MEKPLSTISRRKNKIKEHRSEILIVGFQYIVVLLCCIFLVASITGCTKATKGGSVTIEVKEAT